MPQRSAAEGPARTRRRGERMEDDKLGPFTEMRSSKRGSLFFKPLHFFFFLLFQKTDGLPPSLNATHRHPPLNHNSPEIYDPTPLMTVITPTRHLRAPDRGESEGQIADACWETLNTVPLVGIYNQRSTIDLSRQRPCVSPSKRKCG